MNGVESSRNLGVVERQFVDGTKEKRRQLLLCCSLIRVRTYKSLDFGVSFCLEMTTAPSSLRFADSARTDISPTGWPRRLLTDTTTEGFCALTEEELTRLTTTGTEF